MSAVTFPREGWTALLDSLLAGIVPWVRLYVSDTEPTEDSVRADFVEALYDGYSPIVADRWTPSALRGGIVFSVVDPLIFEYQGEGDGPLIRGYYVTAGRDGPCLWAWRRPGPGFRFREDARILTVYVEFRYRPPVGG